MKQIILSLMLALAVLVSCSDNKPVEESKPVVISYVAGYNGNVDVNRIPAEKITHINYAFALIQDGKVILANEAVDAANLKALTGLKTQNPDLKVLLSVGGWAGSKNFSDAVLTAEGQKAFAKSAVELVKKYDLDGLDIDWEYPATAGAEGNIFRPEDKQNFTLMLAAIRAELDAAAAGNDKKYQLTAAVGGHQGFIDNTEMAKVQEYLDYVNIMTYDYQQEGKAVHHTNLKPSEKYQPSASASKSVDAYIAAGVPAGKLVMGISAYGRVYQLKKGWDKGFDPAESKYTTKSYTNIKDSLVNQQEYYRYWDDAAQAPYLFNFYKGIFITYDDEESVKAKCSYVMTNGLAGVMMWEQGNDNKSYLINAISQSLK
ncbi:glycoside hydrolase family 18 protein [Dysgonomonas sp. 511]|uniref:glycoside hydrolase family 18 protein n=1 Tax=Dysgonomonas sp. 511 TaxID=2302930 RepID=UPI0013D5DF3B|nr:glycoside hydrolase family 18 protein [Dysgonomonas sp. 511]NDV78704.1 chitinase [Dysgonomonas sp. 511]